MVDITERPQVVGVARGIVVKDDKFLLIQRAANDRHDPKLWEFPGGKLEKTNSSRSPTIHDTLRHEIFDETGLFITPMSRLFYLEERVNVDGPYAGLLYLALVNICKYDTGEVKLSSEHIDSKWCTLETPERLPLTDLTRESLAYLRPQIAHELKLRK